MEKPILAENRYFGHNQTSYANVVATGIKQQASSQITSNVESILQTLVTKIGQIEAHMLTMTQRIEALEKKPKAGLYKKQS